MAELLVRFVFEIVLLGLLELSGRIGRFVARPAVAFVSGGRVLVDPPPTNLVVIQRWHGVHRLTDGTPVIGKALAAALGLSLLLVALIVVLIALRWR